jgi:prepilin-type N-terminal cleavage/methylation domain-containing protein
MSRKGTWEDERGFTLAEVLFTIIIMGIVLAIASSTWFGAIEWRRVDSATNQVVADLRLAHSQATNRLTDSNFIVAVPNSSTYQIGPTGSLETRSLLPSDDQGDEGSAETEIVDATTVVFKADGSAHDGASQITPPGDITVAAVDGEPAHTIEINPVTSRITVDP